MAALLPSTTRQKPRATVRRGAGGSAINTAPGWRIRTETSYNRGYADNFVGASAARGSMVPHDLPCVVVPRFARNNDTRYDRQVPLCRRQKRSEEHTSELQSRRDL